MNLFVLQNHSTPSPLTTFHGKRSNLHQLRLNSTAGTGADCMSNRYYAQTQAFSSPLGAPKTLATYLGATSIENEKFKEFIEISNDYKSIQTNTTYSFFYSS